MLRSSGNLLEDFFECIRYVGGHPEKNVKMLELIHENPGIQFSIHPTHGGALAYALLISLWGIEEKPNSSIAELVKISGVLDHKDDKGRSALYAVTYDYAELTLSMNFNYAMVEKDFLENDIEKIEFLLKAGANLEVADNEGLTPLHMAAKMRNEELVMMLIKAGANVMARDHNDRTPLHWAFDQPRIATRKIISVAKRLIFFGADENAQDDRGLTPKDSFLYCIGLKLSDFDFI